MLMTVLVAQMLVLNATCRVWLVEKMRPFEGVSERASERVGA